MTTNNALVHRIFHCFLVKSISWEGATTGLLKIRNLFRDIEQRVRDLCQCFRVPLDFIVLSCNRYKDLTKKFEASVYARLHGQKNALNRSKFRNKSRKKKRKNER